MIHITNGIKQSGILSPRLFAAYVYDLPQHLIDAHWDALSSNKALMM